MVEVTGHIFFYSEDIFDTDIINFYQVVHEIAMNKIIR